MSRRTAERHARRVEVRFWRCGQDQPHSGFTIDLSKTGMFLGTTLTLEPGERLRLEVVDKEKGFQIEGQVARVHRVSLALRHIEQPGVGIRFLGPGELVGQLLQNGSRPGAGARRADVRTARPPAPAERPVAAPPEAAAPAPAPQPSRPARATAPPRDSLEDLFGPDPAAAVAGAPADPPAPAPSVGSEQGAKSEPPRPSPPPAPMVPVEFADKAGFLGVYDRDIAAGGLFVTTDSPASMHEIVLIDLRPPIGSDKILRFEARVVHRFDPQAGGAKPGMTGMGVQFLDPDRVREALGPIVAELRG